VSGFPRRDASSASATCDRGIGSGARRVCRGHRGVELLLRDLILASSVFSRSTSFAALVGWLRLPHARLRGDKARAGGLHAALRFLGPAAPAPHLRARLTRCSMWSSR